MNRRPAGGTERFDELLSISSALADDPKTSAVIASFESRMSTALDTTSASRGCRWTA